MSDRDCEFCAGDRCEDCPTPYEPDYETMANEAANTPDYAAWWGGLDIPN